jgi:hypothetical protein
MKRLLPLFTLAIVLAVAGAAVACPNCKSSEALDATVSTGGGPSEGLPAGFNYSIYFMLGSLFVVIGGISYVIVKAIRDTNRTALPAQPWSSP